MIKYLLYAAAILSFVSCKTLKEDHLYYDEKTELIKYQLDTTQKYDYIFVRNKEDKLVDSSNVAQFRAQYAENKDKFVSDKQHEDYLYNRFSDFKLSKLYAEANTLLLANEYASALTVLDSVKKIYPDISYYSDFYFLQAYAYEKMDSTDKAASVYTQFLEYADGKLSMRFRDQRIERLNDSIFVNQRKYAKSFLNNELDSASASSLIKSITPKYTYNSFTPGYTIDIAHYSKDSLAIVLIPLGTRDFDNNKMLGAASYFKYKRYDAVFYFASSIYQSHTLGLALPLQLYKAPSNRFGIKLSPFISSYSMDSISFHGQKEYIDEQITNTGAKLSLGFQLLPGLSIGTYYTYNYYNSNRRYRFSEVPVDVWYENTFDISLYYSPWENFSFRTGIENGDLISSLYVTYVEIGYNFTTPGLVLRMNMY